MNSVYVPNDIFINISSYDHIYFEDDYFIFCDDSACFNLYPDMNYLKSEVYTLNDSTNLFEVNNNIFTDNYLYYPHLWELCICLFFFLILFVYFPYRVLNRILGGKIYV